MPGLLKCPPVLRHDGLDTQKRWSYSPRTSLTEYWLPMHKDTRGLRFEFSADAEVRVGESPAKFSGRVTELSLRGCFVEISGSFKDQERVRLKIFSGEECFETRADVIYVRPSGIGLLFVEMNAHFRGVLQKWVLAALDRQTVDVAAT